MNICIKDTPEGNPKGMLRFYSQDQNSWNTTNLSYSTIYNFEHGPERVFSCRGNNARHSCL